MGSDPFSIIETIDFQILEDELIDVIKNEELKLKYKKGYQTYWLQKQIPILYPGFLAVKLFNSISIILFGWMRV